MIKSLQSWRGYFAITVLLSHYHLTSGESPFYAGGASAVVFFLILSGFVMCAAYKDRITSSSFNYKNYLYKRGVRVFPLHWFILLLIIAPIFISGGTLGKKPILLNTFACQFLDAKGNFYGLNVPSWCLAPIILFYILFPWLYKTYINYPKRFLIGFASILLLQLGFYKFCLPIDQYEINWFVRVFPPARLCEFVFGMLLFSLYEKLKDNKFILNLSTLSATLFEFAAIGVYVGTVLLFDRFDIKWQSSVMWWLEASILVLTFALLDNRNGIVTRFLHFKPLVYLGTISLCIYLTHYNILVNIRSFGLSHGLNIDSVWFIAITVCICEIVGIIVNELYDRPVTRYLSKLKPFRQTAIA